MKIPKYWATCSQPKSVEARSGQGFLFTPWAWSDESVADAQQKANARAGDLAARVAAGEEPNRYGYADRPMREEIVKGVANAEGREVGIVTRNAYGALVLNAANAMFIDIDFPEDTSQPVMSRLQRLLGGTPPKPNPEELALQHIAAWQSQFRDLTLRVYRTFAGLRCLVTNEVFDPGKPDATAILKDLGSDPLYVRLCRAQECFRARLTPKPWRCNTGRPPARYPFGSVATEARYRRWEQSYEMDSRPFAVCRFVRQLGSADAHPDVKPILALHDQMACSERELKLA
jgi:hypothetical protein